MGNRVVIIGGGIIGVSSAWYLSRSGWTVTVIDRGKIGGACSQGNCGLVCPSHVLPLTEPGAFREAVKAMLNPGAAFRIRPRVDPQLWSWLWHFARRCNRSAMIQAAHGIQALLSSSMLEYQAWVQQLGVQCEWEHRGLLFVYRDRQALDRYASTNELLTELFQEPARKLDAEETVQLEPALQPQIAGSWFYEHDAHLRPDRLLQSLRGQLEETGVTFVEDCELTALDGTGGQAEWAQTTQGRLAAEHFVFASGAWTPLLERHLGCNVPIQPGKGYSITMPRPNICPKIPIIFPQHRVAVTPMQSGYRLGSIMEFAGYDETIRPERLALLREGARSYLQEPYCDPVTSTWYGWRPMTYDSLPVIDRSPRWNNAWIAAGHNMLGLSMAPATGRLLSELMQERETHVDPAPYAVSRFQ
ncbi:MAG: FAD-dependent oxidoreductase [bacterium]|nr:FAD-dependent oxidoreductase [bacterium]